MRLPPLQRCTDCGETREAGQLIHIPGCSRSHAAIVAAFANRPPSHRWFRDRWAEAGRG